MDAQPNTRILIQGYSQSGKSTAAAILARHFAVAYANIGDVLATWLAAATGISPERIAACKGCYRTVLSDFGNTRRATDPGFWAREALKIGPIVTGVRSIFEYAAARPLFDLSIWIQRDGYGAGETDFYHGEMSDLVIENNGTLAELEERLIDEVVAAMLRPCVYIIGRYRDADPAAMEYNACDEIRAAEAIKAMGYRVFAPINTFKPLDNLLGAEGILPLCAKALHRQRTGVDRAFVRAGHDTPPASEGSQMEIEICRELNIDLVYGSHGDAAMDYLRQKIAAGRDE